MNDIEKRWFFPSHVPPDWSVEKDIESYLDRWEPAKDYAAATVERVEEAYATMNAVLEAAIQYFIKQEQPGKSLPVAALSLREKVTLLTDHLPASTDNDHLNQLGLDLAHILWVDSERSRLLVADARQKERRWLLPLYQLADSMNDAAFGLEETMGSANSDFKGPILSCKPPND